MRYASFVLVLAFACISGCASRRDNAAERPFIGTWYAQGQDSSYTWKLDPDGSFGKSKGFVRPKTDDGSWRVDRGELILHVKQDGKKHEQRAAAKVIGNTMTVDLPQGPLIFTRQN